MSQWDDIVPVHKSTYLDDVNAKIAALEADNAALSKIVQTKVINKRTGKARTKTLYQIQKQQQKDCIAKFWIRTPRSNSNSFVYHTVQNTPGNDFTPEPIVLSRELTRG